ncbi:glycosyltransferase family 4 protein [Rhodanobacter denitrificans]|nr:glycosyltransferase family 4 protein [Rhodanobacter denitrificans]
MSGIGRYVLNILAPLDDALPEAQFFLYTRSHFEFPLPSSRWAVRRDKHRVFSQLPTSYWIHYRLGMLAHRDRLDVFWAANTLSPAGLGRLPYVTTVYDINHLLFPETMSVLTRSAHRRWLATDILKASRIVAISEGTSSRLYSRFGRSADAVALPAIPLQTPMPSLEEAIEQLRKLSVRRPYLLTVGNREPRKNLESAISAVAMLRSEGRLTDHQLVMVGSRGWGRDAGRSRMAWVNSVGYVDDTSLAALYALSDAFIFPSFYEGYGMPVGEALAFGCRVVATDLPELREVGGTDAVYVEPTPAGIARGLDVALAMPKPSPRRALHDWADAACVMAKMFRQVAMVPD